MIEEKPSSGLFRRRSHDEVENKRGQVQQRSAQEFFRRRNSILNFRNGFARFGMKAAVYSTGEPNGRSYRPF
jgi:hypothetical protein